MKFLQQHVWAQVLLPILAFVLLVPTYGYLSRQFWPLLGFDHKATVYLTVYVPLGILAVLSFAFLAFIWLQEQRNKGKMKPPEWWTQGHDARTEVQGEVIDKGIGGSS